MRPRINHFHVGSLTIATILASSIGCSVQSGTDNANSPTASEGDFISVHLATTPAFNSKTGAVAITMSDETAELYMNAADSSLMINGVQAIDTTVTPNVTAIVGGTKANVKTITVGDTTGSVGDVVILNYTNGQFGVGSGTTAGTAVNLKAANVANNSLVIKGTAGVDNYAFGASGISLTNGAKTPTKDITSTNVGTYEVFLGAGNDLFTAGGNSAVGAAFAGTNGVSIYGGDGNDTLVEGALTTPKETFSGGNGTDTVDYSARPATHPVMVTVDPTGTTTASGQMTTPGTPTAGVSENDYILDAEIINGSLGNDYLAGGPAGTTTTLNGLAGNDTFMQGSTPNGAETMNGGGGTDVVDYSLRTASLTVTMDGKTASGDPTGNSGSGEGDMIGVDVANIKLGSGGGTYTGNALNNTFFAGTGGASTVNGSTGDDTLNEGPDANGGSSETFNGGAGTDTVDYSARTAALTVTMDGATASGDAAQSEADVIGTDVENVYGGTAADTIVGNDNDNDLEGNGGGDTICGGNGNDTLLGYSAVGNSTGNGAILHGGDCADDADPGYNLCLNTGSTTNGALPAAAGSQNCELVSH
ncbi:MAG TPA: calcium-binding protein [Polyangiaceae bacterium]|nr:calcium-binding protein [Polyangiaceae bacterium]